MILPPEYSWLESFLDNDNFWLEDSLNWDEAFDLALSEFDVFSFFTTPSFYNNHFFVDWKVKISFLDTMLTFETSKYSSSKELYDFFIWDLTSLIYNKFFPLQFLFYTDYQDFLTIILHYSPELMLALTDYINIYWIFSTFAYSPAAVYDIYSDNMYSSVSELVEYFTLFFLFIWLVIFFTNVFSAVKWNNPIEIYFVRLYNYFYSMSREMRMQFETNILVLFFFFFYWTMMIASFEDDQEEFVETMNVACFYFFTILIAYLFYKYSLHYFAFLEASVTEGRGVAFITKQFFRDFINTFALFLRFFILLFRLNVYDTLDDFYDSYYIYLGDFDDDEYLNELALFLNSLLFYDSDNNDDRIYSLEEEHDYWADFYYIYYLGWAKFFTFIFFILEELLRIALAFYICYLIVFEVHAVNCSYVEDNYFSSHRQKFNDFLANRFRAIPLNIL